ncbi:MAG TPA: helix-turn-helix domain-containing protein [Thermomicrobiaceae bacterium]|nr:helix-turn-helix domain-containing protein [Thermomicrobiaceae bacterium]
MTETADLLGISTRTVRRWIHQGKLASELQPGRHGPQYAIARAVAEALRQERDKPAPLDALVRQLTQLQHQFTLLQGQFEDLRQLCFDLRHEQESLRRQLAHLRQKAASDDE